MYIGSLGVILNLELQNPEVSTIDLTGLTATLEIWKPRAIAPVDRSGVIVGTKVRYVPVSGDIDSFGDFRIQIKITNGADKLMWTKTVTLRVKKKGG